MNKSFKENSFLITASLLIEYWYCPRFIYFMKVLEIKQQEQNRLKVQKGRTIHEKKSLAPEYLRKKLSVVKQEKDIYLSDPDLGICGIIDEILTFENGDVSLLDYKFARKKDKFNTQFLQGVFYSLLINANYYNEPDYFYLVYTRESTVPEKYEIKAKDREKVLDSIAKVKHIINTGFFPEATKYKMRCNDCTYKKVCVS